ncbi:MAG TPA: HAD family phosphatase [Solirubrobacterales bacterium]
MIEAVVFDLDGVLIDSESVWDRTRRSYVEQHGGRWNERATREMMGMSSTEWSRYLAERLGVDRPRETIATEVAGQVGEAYREHLPLLPGARGAVTRLAGHWPLGLASSANRELIDLVLQLADLDSFFAATVSSEEVSRGKPAPDVYLLAASRLSAQPERCAAVEDSRNGILSAAAAAMRVVAVPNRDFPPGQEALAATDLVLGEIDELTVEAVSELG